MERCLWHFDALSRHMHSASGSQAIFVFNNAHDNRSEPPSKKQHHMIPALLFEILLWHLWLASGGPSKTLFYRNSCGPCPSRNIMNNSRNIVRDNFLTKSHGLHQCPGYAGRFHRHVPILFCTRMLNTSRFPHLKVYPSSLAILMDKIGKVEYQGTSHDSMYNSSIVSESKRPSCHCVPLPTGAVWGPTGRSGASHVVSCRT